MTFREYIRADLVEKQRMTGTPMNEEDEKDHPAWTRLKAMHDRGDFDKIDRMVKFWDALETLGRVGDLARRIILWLGVMFAAWFAFSEYLVNYIRRAAGQ